jgi:uncharacterized protein
MEHGAMQEAEVAVLVSRVLWAAFALGAAFGAIAQRTQFCTMGAVADIVTLGDWTRMRMWVLAMAVAIAGFGAMAAAGWIDASNSLYAGPRLLWLSHAVGGAMFGVGMVLASGCGSKTLIRIGGGNLKSLVVFFVLGIAAFATLKGITAVLRVQTVDTVAATLPVSQALPKLLAHGLGGGVPAWTLALSAAAAVALAAWVLVRPQGRGADVLLGGIGVGATIVAMWWVSGRLGFVAEHPLTLEATFLATNSQRMEAMSFVAPQAYLLDWLMFFSDKSKGLTVGIVSALGVVAGSAVVAVASGTFRWEAFAGPADVAHHLVGAALMGVGGITAVGCTIGQGVSGVSTLSIGSFIALAGILAGAVGALHYQARRMERTA